MEAQIKIPTELKEISLGAYQRFLDVSDKTNDDTFLFEKMIEIFCDVRLMEVIQIKWSDVQYIVQKISNAFQQKPEFQQTFKIKDIEFGFIPNLEIMSFGEFIDLQNNIEDHKNLHKMMAVLYRPIIEKKKDKYIIEQYEGSEKYSELMKYVSCDIALAAKVFFCDLQKELLKSTLIYLTMILREKRDQEDFHREFSLQNNGVSIVQYMESLREIYTDLGKQQGCPYMIALPSSLLKNRKEILSIVRSIDN